MMMQHGLANPKFKKVPLLSLSAFKGMLWGDQRFLRAFTKLWKATISLVMYVGLSVRIELPGPLDGFINEISYLSISQKAVEKITVSLKSDKNNDALH
jgi:hypothetical protein